MFRKFILRHDKKIHRLLEILPGFVSWNLILFPYWGVFVIPNIVAYFILAFNIYWFYQSLTIALTATISHLDHRQPGCRQFLFPPRRLRPAEGLRLRGGADQFGGLRDLTRGTVPAAVGPDGRNFVKFRSGERPSGSGRETQ